MHKIYFVHSFVTYVSLIFFKFCFRYVYGREIVKIVTHFLKDIKKVTDVGVRETVVKFLIDIAKTIQAESEAVLDVLLILEKVNIIVVGEIIIT